MTRNLILICAFTLFTITKGLAQASRVNEKCDQMFCESGLYCIKLKNGDQKCATCSQSTSDDLTGKVDECCKGQDEAWTPEKAPEYQDVLASDGRVMVDVYDVMLEKAKKCKEARVYREYTCWNNGDDEHKKAINQVAESIDRISTHKGRQISDRRVYYCSESTYESKLSTFKSKCSSSTLDYAKRGLDDLNYSYNRISGDASSTDKINCSTIENYINDCKRCSESAEALLYDGFQNNIDKLPKEYFEIWNNSEDIIKMGKELLQKVKDKNLCN